MTHEEFMKLLTRHMYIWRMAVSQVARGTQRTQLARAKTAADEQAIIDNIVIQRAATIADERLDAEEEHARKS